MSEAVTTQVGYGRNKGDGSDTQNLQPADEMHRYADQSDSFFDTHIQKPEFSFENDGFEKHSENLRKACDEMFEKASPMFNNAMNALSEYHNISLVIDQDTNGSAYVPSGFGFVRIGADEIENYGNPFYQLPQIVQHEYTHAIDHNIVRAIGGTDYGSVASQTVQLKSTGGLTLLQCAEEELGDLDEEFSKMLETAYDESSLEKEIKEHYAKLSGEISNPNDILSNELARVTGIDSSDVSKYVRDVDAFIKAYEESEPISINKRYFLPNQLVSDEFIDKLKAESKKTSEWLEKTQELQKRKMNVGNEKAKYLCSQYGTLNDIMSAANRLPYRRGRSLPIIGRGHSESYFSSDKNRATEIFAEIGVVLDSCPESAKWLKEKAPKLVSGYFELLQLATESFRKKEGV